jgi:hypothetical protein
VNKPRAQVTNAKPVTADQAKRIDAAMLADKLADGYGARNDARALQLQIQRNPTNWGYF